MIDEMPNDALVKHVLASEDASELEMELADRLRSTLEEIHQLVETVRSLESANANT